MNPDSNASLIRRAAVRARTRHEYLGWVLAQYEDLERMSEDDLCQRLRVAVEDWPRLQLCLRPRSDSFLPDVTRIAAAFGVERADLAALIRQVEAVEVVRGREQPGGVGSLLAARTRKQQHPPPDQEASRDERP